MLVITSKVYNDLNINQKINIKNQTMNYNNNLKKYGCIVVFKMWDLNNFKHIIETKRINPLDKYKNN